MNLPISAIRLDGGTQPRAQIDQATVEEYRDDMIAGAVFPPVDVVFDGQAYWLYDGFHRVAAARQAGLAMIMAQVRQGTLEEAQWLSYGVNRTHGLRRTNEDKRRAVEAALSHAWHSKYSDAQIAGHCGVSREYVNRLARASAGERQTERTVVRGESVYIMDTTNIGQTADPDLTAGVWRFVQTLVGQRVAVQAGALLDIMQQRRASRYWPRLMAAAEWPETVSLVAAIAAVRAVREELLYGNAEPAPWQIEHPAPQIAPAANGGNGSGVLAPWQQPAPVVTQEVADAWSAGEAAPWREPARVGEQLSLLDFAGEVLDDVEIERQDQRGRITSLVLRFGAQAVRLAGNFTVEVVDE